MSEKETAEIELSPWEIEVGNSYHAYLLSQHRMEDELEYSGKNHNIYHEVDDQARALLDGLLHDPKSLEYITPHILRLPLRDIRTSYTRGNAKESQLPGLFANGSGGPQFDPYSRFYIPATNEVLLVGQGANRKFIPDSLGSVNPNKEFVGIDALLTGDFAGNIKILKTGDGEEYGQLTFDEIQSVLNELSIHFNFNDDQYNMPAPVLARFTEADDMIYKLKLRRYEMKDAIKESSGKRIKNVVASLTHELSAKFKLNSDYYRINFPGVESSNADGVSQDKDYMGEWKAPVPEEYGRNHVLWFCPEQSELVIAPYILKPPSGAILETLKILYGDRSFLPEFIMDREHSVIAPGRFWCKTASLIVEDLMRALPKDSLERIFAVFGRNDNAPS